MSPTTKTFDCVEMKRESQRRLLQEFEARRNEFDDYAAFIRAKAGESEWVRKQRRALSKPEHTLTS